MLPELINQKKLLFFGGKGGVGKTTVSAATALLAAQQGKRTLLISTDPAHNLGHLFNRELGADAVSLAENLDAIELDPEHTVEQHLQEVTTVLRRLMPVQLASEVDKHIDLSRQAPGMQEAAILERMAELTENASAKYDLIIFDTAPSGHTSRLMALPEMMSAWTEGLLKRRDKADKLSATLKRMSQKDGTGKNLFGNDPTDSSTDRDDRIRHILNRRRQRFSSLRDRLNDKNNTAFIIVLAAERLPVLETIELHQQLNKTGVNVASLIINKRSPKNLGEFIEARRLQEEEHLKTLRTALPKIPTQEILLWKKDIIGVDALKEFVKTLD